MVLIGRVRAHAASEDGFALMEAVVAAAVLVLVVMGVLAAMDAASGTAGANKARTVAATLAEEDQERLRGMATADVDAGSFGSRDVTVANVKYTITSKAEWVRDATGETVSCSTEAGQASYMRITSTVTSAATGAALKPVVLSSIVAPRAGAASQGTLAVMVKNAAGLPVVNLPVEATGPMTRTELTNEAGCAVFGLLDPGSYQVKLNTGGWVDKAGTPTPIQTATVTHGNVSTLEFAYDKASSLTVQVKTRLVDGSERPDPSTSVVAANTGVPPSGFRLLKPASPATTIALGNLFPFPDGYTVYSGTCPGADPANFVPDYYASHQGVVTLAPGVPGGTISVLEPAINLQVTRGGNQAEAPTFEEPQSRAYIYVKTAGCTPERFEITPLERGGRLPNPGFPFGDYDICVGDGQGRSAKASVTNDDPDGTATIPLWIDTTNQSTGDCP
jgi:hypothetical protein